MLISILVLPLIFIYFKTLENSNKQKRWSHNYLPFPSVYIDLSPFTFFSLLSDISYGTNTASQKWLRVALIAVSESLLSIHPLLLHP